jgi:hypothetical protein
VRARWVARIVLFVVTVADAGLIAVLHGLGSHPLFHVPWSAASTWASADPIPIIASGFRLMALVAAYWLVVTIIIHTAQTVHRHLGSGFTGMRRFAKRRLLQDVGPVGHQAGRAGASGHSLSLPWIRHLIERAMGPTLAASILVSSTAAAAPVRADDLPPIPVVVEVQEHIDDEAAPPQESAGTHGDPPAPRSAPIVTSVPDIPMPAGPATSSTTTITSPEAFRGTAAVEGLGVSRRRAMQAATTHTVRPGDCFWTIASDRIHAFDPATDVGTVSRYWAATVEANRGSIRSGDPDLIFPGEVVQLPAIRP